MIIVRTWKVRIKVRDAKKSEVCLPNLVQMTTLLTTAKFSIFPLHHRISIKSDSLMVKLSVNRS